MVESEGFKHITVTAPEEDDVVIHAGMAVDRADDAPEPDAGVPAREGASPVEPAETSPRAPVRADANAGREPRGDSRARSKKEGGYHETTLEDLERAPMPITQKVVIVAAIVCLIGAVIYYFAFMR